MAEQRTAVAMPAKLILYILSAGMLVAALAFPVVGGVGAVANRLSDVTAEDSAQLLEGEVPIVSTMVDAAGNPKHLVGLAEQFDDRGGNAAGIKTRGPLAEGQRGR